MTACIVGWSHGKFGKLDDETSESLIVKAATEAIAHAGIEPKDVDVIYVGNMNGGFVRQEFHSSLALQAHPDGEQRLDQLLGGLVDPRRGKHREPAGGRALPRPLPRHQPGGLHLA